MSLPIWRVILSGLSLPALTFPAQAYYAVDGERAAFVAMTIVAGAMLWFAVHLVTSRDSTQEKSSGNKNVVSTGLLVALGLRLVAIALTYPPR